MDALPSSRALSRPSSRQIGTSSSKTSGRSSANINNNNRSPGAGSPGMLRRRQQGPQPTPTVTENDFLLRQPPTGYLEHKRLEVAALSLQSAGGLSACVVGAGVPYGLGEGPLLRVFRDAWRAGDEAVLMPTCTSGDNRLALVSVLDLSGIVANLLSPVDHHGDSPAPFPKPYILAVDGDGAQCSTKELTAAVGCAFGGKGHTRAMGEEELEEMLVEDPAALALMIDVKFSNKGGVVAGMVADGEGCSHYVRRTHVGFPVHVSMRRHYDVTECYIALPDASNESERQNKMNSGTEYLVPGI